MSISLESFYSFFLDYVSAHPCNTLEFSRYLYSQNLTSSSSLKANAGEDQYVEEGKPVILNAEDSVSSEPPIDSFNWVQLEPKTPIIDLENGNTSRASFTSPNLPNDGYFIFELVVKDQNVTDTDTVNVYVVEDLASTDKEITGNAGYQPEICFDGADNDLDGKIDLQDEECGLTFSPGSPLEGPLQGLLPPQSGGIPFNPNNPNGQPGLPPGPFPPGQGQPGQGSPGHRTTKSVTPWRIIIYSIIMRCLVINKIINKIISGILY